MSPRPRQVSNDQILAAALRTIARLGPTRMTLADIGKDVGVSAAALVQRFSSKRQILLAIAEQGPEANRGLFAALRAAESSPLAALLALGDCMEQLGRTPAEIAHSLAFLQIDLEDAEFHRHALGSSTAIYQGIRGLVASARKAGELRGGDPGRLARALQATMNGSLLNWAIHREGGLRAWVRRDLETVLAPYRTGRGPAGGGRRTEPVRSPGSKRGRTRAGRRAPS